MMHIDTTSNELKLTNACNIVRKYITEPGDVGTRARIIYNLWKDQVEQETRLVEQVNMSQSENIEGIPEIESVVESTIVDKEISENSNIEDSLR